MGFPSCLAIRYKSGIRSFRILGEYMGLLSSSCPKGSSATGVKPKRKTQLTGVGLLPSWESRLIVSSGMLLQDCYGVGMWAGDSA